MFLKKIWLRQSLDVMVSYHHVPYQKKLMIQSWENLVTDGRTDERTDGQTDESDFIGRCPTNVERPTIETLEKIMICKWRRYGLFIVIFKDISHLSLVFLSLTLDK